MAENPSFLCRRTFVTTALLGLAGCAAACSTTAHWYTPDTNSQADALEVPLSALGPENYVILDAKNFPAPILLARQDQNYTAVEMICTHRGCAVHVQRNRLVCPCHGSQFELNGIVLHGPAAQPLRRFSVQQNGDILHITRSS